MVKGGKQIQISIFGGTYLFPETEKAANAEGKGTRGPLRGVPKGFDGQNGEGFKKRGFCPLHPTGRKRESAEGRSTDDCRSGGGGRGGQRDARACGIRISQRSRVMNLRGHQRGMRKGRDEASAASGKRNLRPAKINWPAQRRKGGKTAARKQLLSKKSGEVHSLRRAKKNVL